MELMPGRRTTSFHMANTVQFAAPLALARRSLSLSR